MKRALVVACILIAALAGCSTQSVITTGTVVSKQHTPGSDTTVLLPFPNGNNSFIYMPVTRHDPESWEVTFQSCDPSCVSRTVSVDKNTWNALKPGDKFTAQ